MQGKSASAGMPSSAASPAASTRRSIEPLHARHRGDRHARVGALDHEQRPDEIVDGKAVLGDEPARPGGAAVAAQAHEGEAAGPPVALLRPPSPWVWEGVGEGES